MAVTNPGKLFGLDPDLANAFATSLFVFGLALPFELATRAAQLSLEGLQFISLSRGLEFARRTAVLSATSYVAYWTGELVPTAIAFASVAPVAHDRNRSGITPSTRSSHAATPQPSNPPDLRSTVARTPATGNHPSDDGPHPRWCNPRPCGGCSRRGSDRRPKRCPSSANCGRSCGDAIGSMVGGPRRSPRSIGCWC